MRLDPFYPIVESAAWVRRLVSLGPKLIQLRIKDQAVDEVRRQVRAAREVCQEKGVQLVVNDHWEVALEEKCDFVHLGQGDLKGADLEALRRAEISIGVSTHDDAELENALGIDPDYVALGPVYPTLLKKMPWAPQGLERVTEWKKRVGELPLVAIGGLTVERAAGVLAAGADTVAVVTDVVRHPNPEARVGQWLAATR